MSSSHRPICFRPVCTTQFGLRRTQWVKRCGPSGTSTAIPATRNGVPIMPGRMTPRTPTVTIIHPTSGGTFTIRKSVSSSMAVPSVAASPAHALPSAWLATPPEAGATSLAAPVSGALVSGTPVSRGLVAVMQGPRASRLPRSPRRPTQTSAGPKTLPIGCEAKVDAGLSGGRRLIGPDHTAPRQFFKVLGHDSGIGTEHGEQVPQLLLPPIDLIAEIDEHTRGRGRCDDFRNGA